MYVRFRARLLYLYSALLRLQIYTLRLRHPGGCMRWFVLALDDIMTLEFSVLRLG